MYPSKIISGGQTGADIAGLEAAAALKLETGGTAPYNWMTDEGPKRHLLISYGLVAGPYDPSTYPIRTQMNIEASDGTLLVGKLSERGSRLTASICLKQSKPLIENPTSDNLGSWLMLNKIATLNVAGNRERINPGIFASTVKLLLEAIDSPNSSYDMVCLNCETRRTIEMTEEEYQSVMDDGGPPCIETIFCKELMVPYSSLQ